MNEQELQDRIAKLEKQLQELTGAYYSNNFSATQDFLKYSRFRNGIQATVYSSLPATCEVGQLGVNGGELYVCSAADTWSLVGTQS
jgi:hypothetical protein